MLVTHLYHSGCLIELEHHSLLFDYYQGDLKLNQQKPLYIFVSHRHFDHYNPQIFKLKHPKITYILSNDLRHKYDGNYVDVHQTYHFDDIKVKTLLSTDEGCAFIVEVENKTIYFAGDLNWWHWEGEPASWNRNMETGFRREIDSIAGERFDAAFVPLDPRLEAAYGLGMDYFLQKTSATHVFPMHMWEEYGYISKYKETQTGRQHAAQIVDISRRGEEFVL